MTDLARLGAEAEGSNQEFLHARERVNAIAQRIGDPELKRALLDLHVATFAAMQTHGACIWAMVPEKIRVAAQGDIPGPGAQS